MELTYNINSKDVIVECPESENFFSGENLVLSRSYNDLILNTNWYEQGYSILNFSKVIKFEKIEKSVTKSVEKIIKRFFPDKSLNNFSLPNYHKYVTSYEHLKIDKVIKRLYPVDFGFDDNKIVSLIEEELGKPLSYKQKSNNTPHWIIVRISMPQSSGLKGFNPVHKDIYEGYDNEGIAPRMINSWIPICGVNNETGLPIVPGSHLINENQIIRTKCGSTLEGQKYSVNSIKSWSGENKMLIASPDYGSMLLFSSHLIHGLGRNNNLDETRVALEFRLHFNEKKYNAA